jgi:hypothetical protein
VTEPQQVGAWRLFELRHPPARPGGFIVENELWLLYTKDQQGSTMGLLNDVGAFAKGYHYGYFMEKGFTTMHIYHLK